jgi:hypothetical protein
VADADFVNRVVKLLYRIGFQSELGFKSVMKMKDQWQNFSKVYCRALGSTDTGSNTSKPRPQQQQQQQQRAQGISAQPSL